MVAPSDADNDKERQGQARLRSCYAALTVLNALSSGLSIGLSSGFIF